MRIILKHTLALLAGVLLFGVAFSTKTTAYATEELRIALQEGDVVEQLNMSVGESVDLRFLGAPSDWALLHPRWISSNSSIAEVNYAGVVSAKTPGIVCIHIMLDNGMLGYVFVFVEEPDSQVTEIPKPEDVTDTDSSTETNTSQDKPASKKQVLLKNQEAIHIPDGTTFADGTPLENIYDIVTYAFSFMLEDGTPVIIPTYEGDPTGISELAGVDFRPIKGAKTIIVKSVYLKVFFDTDDDQWISSAEKGEEAIGFYCVKVDVDKTLTVEDWSLVEK